MDNIEQYKQYTSPASTGDQLGITPDELQKTLKLAGLLQTSLEIDSIISYFLKAAQQIVSFDAAHYDYDKLELKLKHGKTQRHRCSYRLRLAGEDLGELVFSRRRRFAEQEMEDLENLIAQLIYPIRNAIWYQKALLAAKVDPLTGANNRSSMDNILNREIDFAHRHKTAMSMLIFDLDHFKNVNDSYGHTTGDEVLRECVKCSNQALRSTDTLFRFGGEEFVILLPGVNASGATLAAERLRSIIEKHIFNSQQGQIPVTISLGTASLSAEDTRQSLIERADKALYMAKNTGRNRTVCAEDIPAATAVSA